MYCKTGPSGAAEKVDFFLADRRDQAPGGDGGGLTLMPCCKQ